MELLTQKLQRPQGLCTSVANSDVENFSVMLHIVNSFLNNASLERASRTEDNWEQVVYLPMNFEHYRYREVIHSS